MTPRQRAYKRGFDAGFAIAHDTLVIALDEIPENGIGHAKLILQTMIDRMIAAKEMHEGVKETAGRA